MKHLDIGIKLPIDIATRAIALVGSRGSGKTTTSTVLVEQMFKADIPVVILDPVGARWGIRSSADGKSAGLPFVLFGGEHDPNAPLYEESGETLADAVLEYGMSAVLDLSLLRKNAMRRFAVDFLERLYQKSRSSMHLVLEEAPVFAPQRVEHGAERLLGACEDIVLRGRGRGIGVTLISQRAQSINKSVLSQCEVLFAMRQSHNLDKKAIREWMDQQGDDHLEVIDELAGLPTGECFAWAPVLGLLSCMKTRQRETFDSGATPKPGERRVEPKKRAEIDMEALKGRLAATIERAKADDPKALRAKIVELEKALAKRAAIAPPPPPERVEVPVVPGDVLNQFVAAEERMHKALAEVRIGLAKYKHAIAPQVMVTQEPYNAQRVADSLRRALPPPPRVRPQTDAPNGLRKGAREMLRALVVMQRPLSRAQVATLAGLSPNSGTFSTYLGDLRGAGYIDGDSVTLVATVAGHDYIRDENGGRETFAPTPEELRALWTAKFRAGARRMLEVILDEYPKTIDRGELAQRVGISSESGTFSTYLGELVSNGLVERHVRGLLASETMFMSPGGRS